MDNQNLTNTPAALPQEGNPGADIAAREAELARREEEVRRRELRALALEELAAQQMPAELCDLLDYSGEEAWRTSLETLLRVWRTAVQKGVEARVASAAPKAGGAAQTGTLRDAIAGHYNK